MKYLHGALLAISVCMLPATALTDEDQSHNKGKGMVTVNMETSAGSIRLAFALPALRLNAPYAPGGIDAKTGCPT